MKGNTVAEKNTRIYLVKSGDKKRLSRAANSTQARNHVAKESIQVAVPTQDELLDVASLGIKVEDAGAEVEQEPAAS